MGSNVGRGKAREARLAMPRAGLAARGGAGGDTPMARLAWKEEGVGGGEGVWVGGAAFGTEPASPGTPGVGAGGDGESALARTRPGEKWAWEEDHLDARAPPE